MSRALQLGAAVVASIVVLAALVIASGFRLPASPGAAPGGSAAPAVPRETPVVAVESAPPSAPLAVDNGAEPSFSLGAGAQPPNSECVTVRTVVDRVPMTLDTAFRLQDGVVLATVLEVGPAQWNTLDGKPPIDADEAGAFNVMRLVRLSADRVWDGDIEGTFVASVAGGTIGCWTFLHEEVPEVVSGRQYAVFLHGTPLLAGLEQVHAVRAMWPIDPDGRIRTPEDGLLTVAEFSQRIEQLKAQ